MDVRDTMHTTLDTLDTGHTVWDVRDTGHTFKQFCFIQVYQIVFEVR